MAKKQPNWYGLDMLPLYLQLSRDQLHESIGQLQNLQKCSDKPYLLNDHMINRVIKVFKEQNGLTWVFIEQCSKWRKLLLNQQELADILEVENNIQELNKTNNQVLDLAKNFKNRTINRILEKDDMEIGLDFLKGIFR